MISKLNVDFGKFPNFRRNQLFGHNFRAGMSGKKLFIHRIDIGMLEKISLGEVWGNIWERIFSKNQENRIFKKNFLEIGQNFQG